MDSLVANLRALARYVHSDMTVAEEAADEIERLRAANEEYLRVLNAVHERAKSIARAIEWTRGDEPGDNCP